MALAVGLALSVSTACGPAEEAPATDPQALPPSGWLSERRPLTAFAFLGTECPLSGNYTKELRELSEQHDEVEFVAVFPLAVDGEEQVAAFCEKYALPFATRMDHDYELVHALEPTVTPEVFLLNARAEVLYSGKIDNWAVELGRTRRSASEHYLADAIDAALAGEPVERARVAPVGCLLPEEPYAGSE